MNNMNPSLKLFFTTFLVCITVCAYAQRDSVRVRVFNPNQDEPVVTRHYEHKNYLRFNPYLLLRGAFTIGYERILHDKHSVGIDAGLTYRDFFYETINDDDSEGFGGDDAKIELGQYVDVSYKFYPKDYGEFDEAFYLSPGFIYRTYNISIPFEYFNGTDLVLSDVDAGYEFTETYLKIGYLRESWAFDGIISDVYFGVGYRNATRQTYEEVELPSGGYGLKTGQEKKSAPSLYLGVKIGFTW